MLQFERFYDVSYSANSCNATNKYIVNSCIDTCTKDTIYKWSVPPRGLGVGQMKVRLGLLGL